MHFSIMQDMARLVMVGYTLHLIDALWDTMSGLYSEYSCTLEIQTPLQKAVSPLK